MVGELLQQKVDELCLGFVFVFVRRKELCRSVQDQVSKRAISQCESGLSAGRTLPFAIVNVRLNVIV